MEIKTINIKSNNPYCVLGVVDNERGREIAAEMREWLVPHYKLIEVWHDGTLFEQPALRYVQNLCATTKKPCLYIHTKGAFNRPELSAEVRAMWKHEFTANRDLYFGLVNRPYGAVACPFTGRDKTTWYNGFVTNAQAMAEIPRLDPHTNRMTFERIFINQTPQVFGVVRSDFHREFGRIDEKFQSTWALIQRQI